MGQPIFLYDKSGKKVTLYAPVWAAQQVKKGIYFLEKPKRKYTKRKGVVK